ncbi:hypothetical protein M0804_008928 [Polistes exclamans]|nr:hypothetical protein M0804_008928 [Polistes exclamans]
MEEEEKEKEEEEEEEEEGVEAKHETTIYKHPNSIQAIRRNNLACGESVILYLGRGLREVPVAAPFDLPHFSPPSPWCSPTAVVPVVHPLRTGYKSLEYLDGYSWCPITASARKRRRRSCVLL